uniref:Uncharacterized protein n=1 Tax=viral metagenome TaxID=1070528 RepID=A0A6M3IKM4_9ZZZZ
MLQEIVKQLESCNYECEAGSLVNNTAFIELKKLADKESIPLDLLVSKILAGYDAYLVDSKAFDSRGEAKAYVEAKQVEGKITDHIRFYSMEMSSKYMLIVYEEVNDNQYYANSGLAPNRIEKVGTANNITYMLVRR